MAQVGKEVVDRPPPGKPADEEKGAAQELLEEVEDCCRHVPLLKIRFYRMLFFSRMTLLPNSVPIPSVRRPINPYLPYLRIRSIAAPLFGRKGSKRIFTFWQKTSTLIELWAYSRAVVTLKVVQATRCGRTHPSCTLLPSCACVYVSACLTLFSA